MSVHSNPTLEAERELTESVLSIDVSEYCESLRATVVRQLRANWNEWDDDHSRWWGAIEILSTQYHHDNTALEQEGIEACALAAHKIGCIGNLACGIDEKNMRDFESAVATLQSIAARLRVAQLIDSNDVETGGGSAYRAVLGG